MNYLEQAKACIDLEARSLLGVRDSLGEEFNHAVDIFLDCLSTKGKIVVTGVGKNLHVAEKISATLASTGATSVSISPTQAMHGDLGVISEGDVLLALSYSGESDELLAILPMVKRVGVKIVCITGVLDSNLAHSSDVTLNGAVEREACPFNMAPTSSTTAAMAIGDALAMVVVEARGFKKEDYAKLHPGGSIGRALLLRVSDIMRSNERLVSLRKTDKVKDALLAMTKARAGSAGVTDDDNTLLGIFTDGDLRRHLASHDNVLDLNVEAVMTCRPITVFSDQLAVDVLRTFEEHKIDDLLVVDRNNHLVGAIDVQDLPKFKIL